MGNYERFLGCGKGVVWSCYQEDRVVRSCELRDEDVVGVVVGVGSHEGRRQAWVQLTY